MHDVDDPAVVLLHSVKTVGYLDTSLDCEDVGLTAIHQEELVLQRVRRVRLVVHSDSAGGPVILAGDYEKHCFFIMISFSKGEVESNFNIFGTTFVAWEAND